MRRICVSVCLLALICLSSGVFLAGMCGSPLPGPVELRLLVGPPSAAAFPPHLSFPNASNVAMIVDEATWEQMTSAIIDYANLVTAEHWNVYLEHGSWSSASELRSFLAHLHQEVNLTGVLLVGDLPTARYETDAHGYPASVYPQDYISERLWAVNAYDPEIPVYHFPTEWFFADLDGRWLDSTSVPDHGSPNGVYDGHEDPDGSGPADLQPEVWIARIIAPLNVTGYPKSRAQLLADFFERACNYHRGRLVQTNRVLIDANAYPDDLAYYAERVRCLWTDQVHLNGSKMLPGSDESTAERWVGEIQNSYAHAIVNVHGGGCCYGQRFQEKPPTYPQGYIYLDYVFYNEIRAVNDHVAFYLLDSCKVANFTHPNNQLLWYLFGAGDTLVTMGHAIDSGPTYLTTMYDKLAAGKTIGESFAAYLREKVTYSATYPDDHLLSHGNLMIFGDPFYRFRDGLTVTRLTFEIQAGPLLSPPQGAISGVSVRMDGTPVTTANISQYLIIDQYGIVRRTGNLSWTGTEWASSTFTLSGLPSGEYHLRAVFEAYNRRGISPDTTFLYTAPDLPWVIVVGAAISAVIIGIAIPVWRWRRPPPPRLDRERPRRT